MSPWIVICDSCVSVIGRGAGLKRTANVHLVGNAEEHKYGNDVDASEKEEIVVQMALVADFGVIVWTRDAAVDVASVPVKEPSVVEAGHEGCSQEGPKALSEPVQAHHEALHGSWCMDVGKLQSCKEEVRLHNWELHQGTGIIKQWFSFNVRTTTGVLSQIDMHTDNPRVCEI